MGYSVAQSNAAWVLEQQLVSAGRRMHASTPQEFSRSAVQWLLRTVYGQDEEPTDKATKASGEDKDTINAYSDGAFRTSRDRGERALHLYAQAAAQGHEWARLKMGDLLFYGLAGAIPVSTAGPTSTSATQSSMGILFEILRKIGNVFSIISLPESGSDVEGQNSEEPKSMGAPTDVVTMPDYERAKFHYTQAYSLSRKSTHVQSRARFALGWMYERGFPAAGMPRDIHLAKRMYDDAGSLSRDAKIPVQVALLRMRATEAVYLIFEFLQSLLSKSSFNDENGKLTLDESHAEKSKQKKMKKKQSKKDTITKDAKGIPLREGSMVRARWEGGSQYFTGYVHNVDLDGSASIQYDDGDFETGVQSQFIERVAKRLHPIWIAKQKDIGATFEDEGNEDPQPKS